MNKHAKIEWVNIGLIPICLILSYFLPLRVLLYSYAFLGPLHYMTEINWLNENQFFSKSKKLAWLLLGSLTLVLSFPHFFFIPGIHEWAETIPGWLNHMRDLSTYGDTLILSCLMIGVSLAFTDKLFNLIIAGIVGFFIGIMMKSGSALHLYIGTFLPTIVHVYIFTAAFMVFGLLKSKSKLGVVTVAMHLVVPVIVIFLPLDPKSYSIPAEIGKLFDISNFSSTNIAFENILGFETKEITKTNLFKTQVFISYAYLYHYLNWFSKTSIIGWNKNINWKKLTIILSVSGLAITAYLIDYALGLKLLFFLSMLHVMLEFPLNVASFKGIFQAIITSKK